MPGFPVKCRGFPGRILCAVGSYEGALAVAAALAAVAISLKLSGLSVSVAFPIEAELLFFARLYYRQSFLRQLTLAGTTWHAWSPVALLHAGVFYLNRFLMARGAYYGHAGLALLVTCVARLFVYDLRQLELPFRILSFLVLGVILIGVSFVYSRFRERISRYL